jgi:hypothetical protein
MGLRGGRIGGDAVFGRGRVVTLYFQDGKDNVVLVKRTVYGRHPLKRVNLAALPNVKTHSVFNMELTLKTGASLEHVEVEVILDLSHATPPSRAVLLGLTPKYDKEVILHN